MVRIVEHKTTKICKSTHNKNATTVIDYYFESLSELDSIAYLFGSQKGGHLSVLAVDKGIKSRTLTTSAHVQLIFSNSELHIQPQKVEIIKSSHYGLEQTEYLLIGGLHLFRLNALK